MKDAATARIIPTHKRRKPGRVFVMAKRRSVLEKEDQKCRNCLDSWKRSEEKQENQTPFTLELCEWGGNNQIPLIACPERHS